MEIEEFQKSFKNLDINLKPYLTVVTILIGTLFLFVIFNKNYFNYFMVTSKVKNNKVVLIVENENLDKIVDNKKLIIGKDTFTYEIEQINDFIYENILLKEITIKINNLDENKMIENSILKLKIITNKTSIFKYLMKTMKGE
jgi:replicative superfamily II helicase